MSDADTPQRDYRDTVFLPKTEFPMKAGLPAKEPGILARWEQDRLYDRLREARKGREKFIFHDGPPYANGDMHIGHALNHVLKDMVVRTQTLLGKDAPYVPGWDCHGLPIEWKVEEQYRKAKKDKDAVPLAEFRAECRAYAQHWVDVQREQLKRLGINADWDHPYLTMQKESEATIVAELLKFAESGQLYRGAKPVMWSPVEKTALAEAEVEYEDVVSTQIDVAFEIVESRAPAIQALLDEGHLKTFAVIWTTTPWTIPVNQALAYGPDVDYVLIPEGGTVNTYLVAEPLAEAFLKRIEDKHPGIGAYHESEWKVVKGSDLAGTVARHPIYNLLRRPGLDPGQGFSSGAAQEGSQAPDQVRGDDGMDGGGVNEAALAFFAAPRPFLPGEFVTTETGTGLVHMAPDHGEDDFELCKAYGLTPKFAVEGDGRYREDWGWLGGQGSVINPKFNAPEGPICSDLRAAGALLAASQDYKHSYPHSWRSKAKVIFRATAQWFVPMDREITPPPPPAAAVPLPVYASQKQGGSGPPHFAQPNGEGDQPQAGGGVSTLRQTALAEIDRVKFYPEKGRNRIGSMVAGRPDWVLSRQRAWGVPITLFVNKASGEYLVDPALNARIVEAVRAEGIDAWTAETAQRFLGSDHDPDEWEPVGDILDVWFDSACTHAFVLESGRWPDQRWPADIYVEGSDQHRGWFQSSLIESCATRGRAPYDAILTHGFTMDAKGMKMSKSLGNAVDPVKVMETYGADIIRLWALSVDYTEDHRIGDEILKGVADQYRKLRNTFRYLLGALAGFDYASEGVEPAEMPELERYVLDRLHALDETLRQCIAEYDFNEYTRALIEFANEDLSAFYFDIRKDCLYCDDPAGLRRRAYRTVLDVLFQALIRYAAPVLVFTAEEVWTTRFPERGSVHLQELHSLPGEWADGALESRFSKLRALRERINEAIEPYRREKIIRSSLEADVLVRTKEAALVELAGSVDMAEFAIAASVQVTGFTDDVVPELLQIAVSRSTDAKCGRCWRLLPEVPEDGALCVRCAEVVAELDAAA